MSISLVQTTAVNQSASNGSTLVITFGSNITAGSLIYVAVSSSTNAQVTSVIDSPQDLFLAIPGTPFKIPATSMYLGVWYTLNSNGGSKTVTLNLSSTAGTISAIAQEWGGVNAIGSLDAYAIGSGGSTSITTSSITTINPNDVLMATWAINNSTAGSFAASGSWGTAVSEANGTSTSIGTESQIVSTVGTYSGTATISSGFVTGAVITAFGDSFVHHGVQNNYQFPRVLDNGTGCMSVTEKIR